jgi:hypothetical protein
MEDQTMGGYAPSMPAGPLQIALSNFAKERRNNALVGSYFAPRVPVAKQSSQYVVFNTDDLRVPGSTLVAPGGRPTGTRRSFSVAPYAAQRHGLEDFIPDESESYGLGFGFSEQKMLTKQLIDQLHLKYEAEIASLLMSTTNFPNGVTLTSSNQFDNYPAVAETGTGSHPIVLIEQYKSQLRQAGIQDADMVLLLSDPVALVLRNHPDIIDRYKFTNAGGIITNEMLSQVFGVKVIVGSAIGLSQNNVQSWIWGNNAFLGFAQQVSTMNDMSCAKTFCWTGGTGPDGNTYPGPSNTPQLLSGQPLSSGTDGMGVLSWPEGHKSEMKTWVSLNWWYDLRVTSQETGIPILNCLGTYPPVAMEVVASDIEG